MKIRKVFKRVGVSITSYEYLAEIDLELDVTKYGNDTMEDRYKKDVFSLEILSKATNFDLFQSDLSKCDIEWWKYNFTNELGQTVYNSKFLYKFYKRKIRNNFLKVSLKLNIL